MTRQLAEACATALHVVTDDGKILKAGRACLFVLAAIGRRRTARLLSLPPLVWLVELGYRLVARHRTFFGRFLFRERRSP
jgi:predicted DCC family thiol-disulfide oxidoreductase YuxK